MSADKKGGKQRLTEMSDAELAARRDAARRAVREAQQAQAVADQKWAEVIRQAGVSGSAQREINKRQRRQEEAERQRLLQREIALGHALDHLLIGLYCSPRLPQNAQTLSSEERQNLSQFVGETMRQMPPSRNGRPLTSHQAERALTGKAARIAQAVKNGEQLGQGEDIVWNSMSTFAQHVVETHRRGKRTISLTPDNTKTIVIGGLRTAFRLSRDIQRA